MNNDLVSQLSAPLDAGSMRDKVDRLQRELSQLPQFEPVTAHYFHGGMYCREVSRPAGILIVGKVHLKEHFYMIVSGTVTVTTDAGVETITGPRLICSNPGTKRAVYSHTDVVTMTFHRTDNVTVDAVEAEVIEADDTAMFDSDNKIKPTVIPCEQPGDDK